MKYELPEIIDREENSKSIVRVEPVIAFEELFPPFLTLLNDNMTFLFDPEGDKSLIG